MPRRLAPALALASLLLSTASCATAAAPRPGGPVRGISQSEMRQGQQAHPQLMAEFGGAFAGPQADYVRRVGQRVAVQSGLANADRDFTVTLLNSPVNNALAIPGGYVYVTRQLLALLNDEAELAAVLGHEVGHVAARHSASRSTRSTIGGLLAGVLGVVTGSPELGQIAGQFAQLYTLRYSRQQEYESDDLGIRYLGGAGYDQQAMATALASLAAQNSLDARLAGQDARSLPEFASTHPDPGARVDRAARRAQVAPAAGRLRNRDAFLTAIDGLLYGDDPQQGIVDGRTFRHPVLRLEFTAPSGFQMANGTRAVSITGRGGQALFSTGPYRGDLADYVGRVFAGLSSQGGVPAGVVRTTRINGLPAAYASTRARSQQGTIDVTVVAYEFDRDSAYHFVTITAAGQGTGPFTPMIDSLRRLTPAEAARIPVREIDVVTVRAGDTAQSLAQRMAFDDAKFDRFLVLNRLAPDARLAPGDRVKLVVFRR